LAISIFNIRIDSQSSITNLEKVFFSSETTKTIYSRTSIYQILTLQGLSMYSSGDEDKIEPTFCASVL